MKPNNRNAFAVMASLAGLISTAAAADIDVIATQTANNPTWGLVTLNGNQTWTSDNVYLLTDRVYVPDGVTLTIQPGTKIYSSVDDKNTASTTDDEVGAIIVARGGMINAAGTAANPIIFDAIQNLEAERGVDLPQDPDGIAGPALGAGDTARWGGIIILGNASISLVDAANAAVRNDVIEGTTPVGATDADGDGWSDVLEYGYESGGFYAATYPQDNADNSGTMTYCSIRHGGYNFSPDNEINGLTLGGVGSGTTIHHIEVFANEDDGVEFFGGTVNTSYMSVAFCKDDSFDIDQGHSGTHQFWFAIQNNNGDNCGEWDGVDTNVAEKSDKPATNVAASNPTIWNATFIGGSVANAPSAGSKKDNGLYLDDSFNGAMHNSIIHDVMGFMASFAGDGSFGTNGFRNNLIGAVAEYDGSDAETAVTGSGRPATFYAEDLLFGGRTLGNTDPGQNPNFTLYSRDGSNNVVSIDPRPTSLNTDVFAGAPTLANYRGAFDGTTNWLEGWTALDELGYFFAPGADSDGDGLTDTIENEIGSDPQVAQTPSEVETLINDYVAFKEGVAEASFVTIGGVEATIDTESGNAVIGFELQGSTDLGAFTAEESFDVGLPSGSKFYRFESVEP